MHKCIHSFWQYWQCCQNSHNIARIPAILICMQNPVLPQRCNDIAAILPETVAAILPQYCCSILPDGLYFDKGYHIASFYDIVHLRFWTVDWVLIVDNYTHANLCTSEYWSYLRTRFTFLMWATFQNCFRQKSVHLNYLQNFYLLYSCCYSSMGWSKLQVVRNLIIADSCIYDRKPRSYRKFAICTGHIGLWMNIEQPKKTNCRDCSCLKWHVSNMHLSACAW